MLDILDSLEKWRTEDRSILLATVTKTWGSAPRRAGSKMGIAIDGEIPDIIGSVSGGCVEGAVIDAADRVNRSGRPELLDFGVSDDDAWDVGLTCGGKISVFVESLDRDWLATVAPPVREDLPTTTVTILGGDAAGAKLTLDDAGSVLYRVGQWPEAIEIRAQDAARAATSPRQVELDGVPVMIDAHQPRPRLMIVGGVHVAMPLQDFARQLGFRVSIIDPRRAFATTERFPDVDTILHSYPQKALAQLGLDASTFLAVLTHDPKIDDPALIAGLQSAAPYVGVLSSHRTHEKRLARLRDAGLTEDQLARIRTPIGVDIGASNPEEIALCIMAEIIAVRNGVQT